MKHCILAILLCVSCTLLASGNTLYSFPGGKYGKGPGLTVNGKTIDFAPVSRMYIDQKFDPAGGCLELTAKFRPVKMSEKKSYLHYLWSASGHKRTVASGVITENNGLFILNFYVFDSNKKPISCACKLKLPSDKSVKLSFIWNKNSISIKVNGILFAKKNYQGQLQSGSKFLIGTAQPNRALIPMTLEAVRLFRAAK